MTMPSWDFDLLVPSCTRHDTMTTRQKTLSAPVDAIYLDLDGRGIVEQGIRQCLG